MIVAMIVLLQTALFGCNLELLYYSADVFSLEQV